MLSSYGSIRAYPTYANLGSNKAAVEAWVRYMAVEFAPHGINVNAVNGGLIDTESCAYFYENVPGMAPMRSVLSKIPKGRMGSRPRGRRYHCVSARARIGVHHRADDLRRRRPQRDRAAVLCRYVAAANADVSRACSSTRFSAGRDRHAARFPIASSWARCIWASRSRWRSACGVLCRPRARRRGLDRHRRIRGKPRRRRRPKLQLHQRSRRRAARCDEPQRRCTTPDGRIALQLFHAGRYAFSSSFGLQPVAPSAIPSRFSPDPPRALTTKRDSRNDRRFCARRVARARARLRRRRGDGVGGLSDQSISLAADESARRRMGRRFRAAHGVSACGAARDSRERRLRFSGNLPHLRRRLDGRLDECRTKRLPSRGRLPATASTRSTWGSAGTNLSIPTVQHLVPSGIWVRYAAAVKAAVGDLPVIASNRINSLAAAEAVLADGSVDFVSMARPFLADAQIVAKAALKQRDTGQYVHRVQSGVHRLLPARRARFVHGESRVPLASASFPRTAQSRNARPFRGRSEAARPGWRVRAPWPRLAIASNSSKPQRELGGQFRMARRIPGKRDFGETIRYFTNELARLGVRRAF